MNEASDDDLDESMDAFEAALSARHIELPAIELGHLLVALDGSNQDASARQLAELIAAQFSAQLHTAECGADGPAFEHILTRCRETQSGLIVVPAPFREDFDALGDASIGTNLDMLLSRRESPLLVVRDPAREPAAALREIVIPLSFLARDDVRAAAWAIRILAPHGHLHVLAVADPATLSGSQPMIADALNLSDLDESALSGLGQPEMAGLIAAVQRRASDLRLGCRVSIRVGPAVRTVIDFCNDLDALLVTACPPDHREPAWSQAHALLRQSRNPVLVV